MAEKYEWIKKMAKGGGPQKTTKETDYLDEEKKKKIEESMKKRGLQKLWEKLKGN